MDEQNRQRERAIRTSAGGPRAATDLGGTGDRPMTMTDTPAPSAMTSTVGSVASAAPRAHSGVPGIGDAAEPQVAKAPAKASFPSGVLKVGLYNNDDVRALQVMLGDIAKVSGIAAIDPGNADSAFGGKTKKAVEAFQADNNIEVTGIADADTLDAVRAIHRMSISPPGISRASIIGKADDEMLRTSESAAMYAGNREADARLGPRMGETDPSVFSQSDASAYPDSSTTQTLGESLGRSTPADTSAASPDFDAKMQTKLRQAAMRAGIDEANMRALYAALGYPQS
jgi:peptidoglycan hydrolase-like protein with peptidoglycan-binding domain